MTIGRWFLAGLLSASAAVVPLLAVDALTWSSSSSDELARGILGGTALDVEGRVALAAAEDELWGPSAGIVWDLDFVDGSDEAWVALSAPGRVLRVAADTEAQTWHSVPEESLVAALADDGAGGVLFGVSPEGRLYRARAAGEVESLALTGARFIWDIERGENGEFWVATGLPGLLLRYDRNGELSTVFDAGEDPVRSIVSLPDGAVAIGTGGRGRVIRVDAGARPFVLLDADEAEIVDLTVGSDGAIYALAASGAKQVSAPDREPAAQATVRVVATAPAKSENGSDDGERSAKDEDEPTPRRTPAPRLKSPPGAALYRIDETRGVQRIWKGAREIPFALAAAGDGLLVATGDRGRIHRVDHDGRASVLVDLSSDQASALAAAADGRVLVGGTDDARVLRLGPGVREFGSYYTPVVDAGRTATWGRIRWEMDIPRGAAATVAVRAGNSADPDETWSDWFPVGEDGALDAGLPVSRWLQARFRLRSSKPKDGISPSITRVELRYLPRNRPPSITDLAVQPAGVVWTHAPAQATNRGPIVADDPVARRLSTALDRKSTPPVRKYYERGGRTVNWRAEDPDGDRLTYRLEVRREESARWIPMVDDEEGSFFAWDARDLPDGTYRARVTVSDARDNAEGEAFRTPRVSSAFVVDNTRPALGRPRIRRENDRFVVDFEASDAGGAVAAVEVAVDAGEWQPLAPVDGVADSDEESYRMQVDPAMDARDGPRTLRVRVTDDAGNLGGEAWPLETP